MSSKITDLALLATASISVSDVFSMVDVSDTSMASTGTTKKFKVGDLVSAYMPLAGGTFSGAVVVNGVTGLVAGDIPTLTAAKISDFATVAASYGPVTTVASRTGTITLTAADIGAGTFAGAMKFLSSTIFGLTGTSGPNIAVTLTPGDTPNKIASTNNNGAAFTLNADDGTGTFSGNLTAPTFVGAITAPLALASGTITTNSPALTLSQTWNASGVQFQGLKVNITNSASSATSKVLDIQTGGTTKISTDISGNATFAGSVVATTGMTFASGVSISQFGALNLGGGSINTVASIYYGNNGSVTINPTGLGISYTGTSSQTGFSVKAGTAPTMSGGTFTTMGITPTMSTTSTAGWTVLSINPTLTNDTSSGVKKLLDLGTGGSSFTYFTSDGVFFPVQAATASAPAYVKGGLYFDTTLNKLRIGGATAWETVTSA